MMEVVEPVVAGSQNVYLRSRSTELLSADLDSPVQDGSQGGQTTCIVGLDVQGAFGGQLPPTLWEIG